MAVVIGTVAVVAVVEKAAVAVEIGVAAVFVGSTGLAVAAL